MTTLADHTDIESDAAADRGTGVLDIDLDALACNYATLREELGGAECGACVKANGYGLGLEPIAKTLWLAGCRDFFVSFIDGGIRLRHILPEARIHVFTGIAGGSPDEFVEHDLVPVLNSLGEIETWQQFLRRSNAAHAVDLHIDTGMSRLGLPEDEIARLRDDPTLLGDIDIDIVMSHLASADMADSEQSRQQLSEFERAHTVIPAQRASLANSSGIFLGTGYHFDLARPGAAIYGINPTQQAKSPMKQVVTLKGKILQVRSVDTPRTVGYGATFTVPGPMRIATVGAGYADGYLRSLSGRTSARINGQEVPIVGRVSMDLITLDVTGIDEAATTPGSYATLIGDGNDIDTVARNAGTIGYEVLTALGARYRRTYHGGATAA